MKIQSPWDKAFFVIGSLWVIIGTAIYISILGAHYGESVSVVFTEMPGTLQWWTTVCYKMHIDVFEIANYPGGTEHNVSFSTAGYIAFIGGPTAIIAICTQGLKWIFPER